MRKARIVPLAFLPNGARGIVRGIVGGRNVRKRLYELGFIDGAEVVVVRNGGAGPLVISIYGSRFALGRGIAMKILVEVGS